MFANTRIAVVMPAYNEAALVQKSISAVPSFVDWIVVVDDASTDATCDRVTQYADNRVTLVSHRRNRGAGAAIQTGYRRALALGADICVVMAADAQMDPRDLPRLLEPVAYQRHDYVKGDRLSHPMVLRDMPFMRWIGNTVLSALTTLAIGVRVRDSQCGYTAISRRYCSLAATADLWPRYGYPNDLLGHLYSNGARVGQVTVRPVYGSEVSGVRLRDAVLVVPLLLARIAWRRMKRGVRSLHRMVTSTTRATLAQTSVIESGYENRNRYF